MKNFALVALVAAFALVGSGCGKDSSDPHASQGGGGQGGGPLTGEPVPALQLEFKKNNEKKLSPMEKAFVKIYEKNPGGANALLDIALFEKYLNLDESGTKSRNKLKEAVGVFVSEIKASEIDALKPEYEEKIEKLHGKKIVYNIANIKPFDVLQKALMQCYSGTAFFEIVRRFSPSLPKANRTEAVVIVQSGHVLPGYMYRTQAGWHLFGIETTAAGKAKIDYGPASTLKDMRVIDADYYAIFEIFSEDLANPKKLMAQALANTAAKYGIANTVTDSSGSELGNEPSPTRNPIFFGKANVGAGNISRQEMTDVNKDPTPILASPDVQVGYSVPASDGPVYATMMAPTYYGRQYGYEPDSIFGSWIESARFNSAETSNDKTVLAEEACRKLGENFEFAKKIPQYSNGGGSGYYNYYDFNGYRLIWCVKLKK